MTCYVGSGVIVCGPPAGVYKRRVLRCGPCGKRHRFVERWDGAYYGTTLYGACGDKWADGEMYPRPFKKGWRKEAQGTFRRMWSNACSPQAYERYVRADLHMYHHTVATVRAERRTARRRAVALELIRRERAA